MSEVDFALTLLRVWAGIVVLAHGINHGRTLEGTANWFAKKGFRSAPLNAKISAANEIALGLGLISGLLTSVAAAGLAATMFVAFWAIHRFVGFFNFHRPDEGYEYVTTLAVASLVIAILGPGSVSIDSALGIADELDGWVGAGIVGAGLVVAFLQLAVFWRKPESGGTAT
ncbi:MAG TPA: DoxX family protein [Acidimicrobiia bacterium]|nr:DoxX family protein [Acidimicrobiia bacterium]